MKKKNSKTKTSKTKTNDDDEKTKISNLKITEIFQNRKKIPAVYQTYYAEWLNLSKNLHSFNKEDRKVAIKIAKLKGKMVKLENQLASLKNELKSLSLTKSKTYKRALSNAVVAYGEKKIIKMLNDSFKEKKLREAGITDRMNISGSKRTKAKSR